MTKFACRTRFTKLKIFKKKTRTDAIMRFVQTRIYRGIFNYFASVSGIDYAGAQINYDDPKLAIDFEGTREECLKEQATIKKLEKSKVLEIIKKVSVSDSRLIPLSIKQKLAKLNEMWDNDKEESKGFEYLKNYLLVIGIVIDVYVVELK